MRAVHDSSEMNLTDKNPLEDPLVEQIMSGFKQNARSVTKDIISGIKMYDIVAHLLLYLALVIAFYTGILTWIGYYQLGTAYGVVGAGGTVLCAVIFAVMSFRFRNKHRDLKKRYESLFILFDKLGVS